MKLLYGTGNPAKLSSMKKKLKKNRNRIDRTERSGL